MFQFAGFPPHSYGFTLRWHAVHAGFPHSDIRGSMLMCSSPRLFAAYRVFHRLPVPGHPPCALLCLTSLYHPHSPSGSFGRSKMVLTCSYRRICKACPSCSLVLLAIAFSILRICRPLIRPSCSPLFPLAASKSLAVPRYSSVLLLAIKKRSFAIWTVRWSPAPFRVIESNFFYQRRGLMFDVWSSIQFSRYGRRITGTRLS